MEKEINRLKMRFLSLSTNEKLARVAVSGFVGLYDPTISDLNDIKTAVSEAVTNCIVHAYRDKLGEVEILAKAYKNGKIYIKIKDFGCGIADVKKAMEPLYTTLPEEERSGLGFSVMESFCDTVKVKSKIGVGTQVILTKQLKPRL